MKQAFIALFLVSPLILAAASADLEKHEAKHRRKPCCNIKEPSEHCGDGPGGCYRNYFQKMDFYHVKPVLTGSGKNWNYLNEELEGLAADDGIFTADCHGGKIDSSVFTTYHDNTTLPQLDNYKFVMYAKNPAEIPNRGDLVVEFEGSGETFKTDQNPYPSEIVQCNDFRLALNAFFAFDFETNLWLSWYLTNDRVYIAYGRNPFGWTVEGEYAAFDFVIPVGMRKPCDWHNMKIVFHAPQKEISWRLDGHEVLRITKPGNLIDRQYMVEDLGGGQTPVFPFQVWYGMGTMTKIQQYPACKRSDTCFDCKFPSVRQALADPGNEFALEMYNPLLGPPSPAIFWANSGSTTESDFIWGQGSILKIRKLAVYQDLCANPRCDC